jgi:hypothetical protein
MIKPTLGLALILSATSLHAGEISSGSASQSNSGVYIGGTTVDNNTPNVAAGSNNNTAPCALGSGVGISGPGVGFSVGLGRVNKDCQIMQEAKALQSLLGDHVALAHLCKHDKTIQATLVDLGLCKVVKAKKKQQQIGR